MHVRRVVIVNSKCLVLKVDPKGLMSQCGPDPGQDLVPDRGQIPDPEQGQVLSDLGQVPGPARSRSLSRSRSWTLTRTRSLGPNFAQGL